ncbi:hypothetical protein POTOM_007076 [Populus tomentosa]|uniref:EF-hand domain-containing protein n=1 Tax=Populus tomentosa TaxID=118781 RepID=A0A8X8ARC1_POPTO|nr:hypothetical protein POTOM_007076 [Populus tomentosa]
MKSHSVSSPPYSTPANSSPLARLRRKLSPRKSHDKPHPTSVNNSTSALNVVDHSNELRRVFNYFDENGDGKISPAELQSCITSVGGKLSIEEAEAAIRFSDMDGDGLLGFQDFLCLMTGNVSEEEKTEDLRQAFGLYETEPGSGCITHTSLKRMLSRLGGSNSINDCKAIIRTFDLNGDGASAGILLLFYGLRLVMLPILGLPWVCSDSSGSVAGIFQRLGDQEDPLFFYCGCVQFCSIVAVGLEKMARKNDTPPLTYHRMMTFCCYRVDGKQTFFWYAFHSSAVAS